MAKRTIGYFLAIVGAVFASQTLANENAPITGTVESKCVIFTETQGVYGTPLASRLSTAATDGGVQPIIRYDVALADAFKGRITFPSEFSSSPSLTDTIAFTGNVEVHSVSDTGMADYDTNKVTFNNTHEYDLTVAGTTKFKITSQVNYGNSKAFPAGTYTTLVNAECIAK
tara:strand:- start:1555 stop:2067 length:513 start_codon:yes stop_codon:yes gene_type:complete